MPRGKKARTDESDKKEAASKAKVEPPPEEEKKKENLLPEITTYIKEHAGDFDSIKGLKELLLNSSISHELVNSVVSLVFEHVEANPSHLSWGKACVQLLLQDVMDPKTRIKEAFFFPNAESEKRLIRYLNRATKSLLVCVFTITNDDLANAIRRAKDRGVQIKIISDDELMRMAGSDIRTLHEQGFQVRVDLDPQSQMHHKFCVIDDYILITGSFNWTKQAVDKNQENIVVLDDPVLAKAYTEEFNRMWESFAASVDRYMGGAKPLVASTAPTITISSLEAPPATEKHTENSAEPQPAQDS